MAAATPHSDLNITVLLDVDGCLINPDGSLSNEIVSAIKSIQDQVNTRGTELAISVNMVSKLFTARQLSMTIKNLYADFIEYGPTAWREKTISLLTKLEATLRSQGVNMCREAPVITEYDTVPGYSLGDSFKINHGPFEEYLLEKGEELLEEIDAWMGELIEPGESKTDRLKDQTQWVLTTNFYERKNDPAVVSRKVELDGLKTNKPKLHTYFEAVKTDTEFLLVKDNKKIPSKQKDYMLAKVIEDLTRKHGENFLIIWADDKAELYEQAKSTVKIGDVELSKMVEKHVIFVHHDTDEPKASKEYQEQITREICGRLPLATYQRLFPLTTEETLDRGTLRTELHGIVSNPDGPIGSMPQAALAFTPRGASPASVTTTDPRRLSSSSIGLDPAKLDEICYDGW